MKFNRDQIIKALEHHTKPIVSSCEGCSYMGVSEFDEDNFCTDYLIKDALALIKELTEECKDFKIRALRAENEAAKYKDRWETSEKDFKRLADNAAEINRLTEKLIPEIKADTVRKMQKRLTSDEFYIVADDYDGMQYVDFCAWVEEVAKEMLED